MLNKDNIINKKQVLELIDSIKIGQRINIKNNQGKLFIRREAINIQYNYKAPSKHIHYNLDLKEVKKYILNGNNKYKIIALPSGLNSFAYELIKIFD